MALPSPQPTPLFVRFRSRVELTIHGGFLPVAGPLLCDPVARVHVVTVKKLHQVPAVARGPASQPTRGRAGAPRSSSASGARGARSSAAASAAPALSSAEESRTTGGIAVTLASRQVGCTTAKYFTSHPCFEETIAFDVDDSSCLTSLAATAPAGSAAGAHELSRRRDTGASPKSRELVEDCIVITVEDAAGAGGGAEERCYGEAYCPFSPHCPSSAAATAPVRVMLQPRNAQDPSDPLCQRDMDVLRAQRLDDFGFLTISWRVVLLPLGGAMVRASAAAAPGASVELPLGLTLRAHWAPPPVVSPRPPSGPASEERFVASVDFGAGTDRFVFSPASADAAPATSPADQTPLLAPIFLTIRSATQLLRAITFHCNVHTAAGQAADIAVDLPLPSLAGPAAAVAALDRDVHWAAPLRSADGTDYGVLLACVRLSRRPLDGATPLCADASCSLINDPAHQEQFSHTAKDWTAPASDGAAAESPRAPSALPMTPPAAYQPLLWENAAHIAWALERRRKHGCLLDAQPRAEHTRHLFDVLMGRAELDTGLARVASAFFNRPPANLTAADLKELMVGCAFHTVGLSVADAARFCFVALRRDVEDAIAIEECHYLFAHALLPGTVDMSVGELRRWVSDIAGDVTSITYLDFVRFFIHNAALWAACGVPLAVGLDAARARRPHAFIDAAPRAAETAVRGEDGAREHSTPQPASAGGSSADWRNFNVSVPARSKSFSITAHARDTVAEAKRLVEGTAGIPAARQEWRLVGSSGSADGPRLDDKTVIGSTALGVAPASKNGRPAEVIVKEAEDVVLVRFIHRAKNLKWQERIPTSEKVLQVRARAQRRTLIPLSRCVLRVVSGSGDVVSGALLDRFPLAHYELGGSDVVEVTQS